MKNDIYEMIFLSKIPYFKYICILLCFISSIFLLSFIKLERYYTVGAYMYEDLLVVNMPVLDLSYLYNNDTLIINSKRYEYSIYDYKEEITSSGNIYYKEVRIKGNFEDKIRDDYNVVKVKIILEKETIFQIILKQIKGEV